MLVEHCRDIGTDFDAIVRSTFCYVMVGATEAEVEERIATHEARLAPILGEDGAEELIRRFLRTDGLTLRETPEQVVERLAEMPARGLGPRDLRVPHSGPRPLWPRALRARGHPRP